MSDVLVIEEPSVAHAALSPARLRIINELRQGPASAAMLAGRLALPRQQVSYHVGVLERHGLVREAEARQWGGIRERLVELTAEALVISPATLGPAAEAPEGTADPLSARYLIALAARTIREVAGLRRQAVEEDKRVATLAVDTSIGFRTAKDRAEFTDELTRTLLDLAARYHDESGRLHRVMIAAHQQPKS